MKFLVTWEVWYVDEDIKYHASEYEEAENLEELIEYLDSGKEKDFFSPELKAPYHEGNFNIEYVLVESEAGERLWKDPEYEPGNGPELLTEDDDPSDTVKKITNRVEFIAAVKSDGALLENGRDEFKDDKEIVHEAIKEAGGWVLEYASDSLRSDRSMAIAAAECGGGALQYLSDELKADREVVFESIKAHGSDLEFASSSLLGDKEMVLIAVKQDGKMLEYANDSIKADKEVVLIAVEENGWALEYVSESLRKDEEILFKVSADIKNMLIS